MSNVHSLKVFQRPRERRKSLEEKAKIFEEETLKERLSIDRKLLLQILQEEIYAHDDAVKKINEKLQEENRASEEGIRELQEKIADLDRQIADLDKQIKPPSEVESMPTETPSEPAQETTEPQQETSTEVNENENVDPFQDVRILLQEPKSIEPEALPEASQKKKRSFLAKASSSLIRKKTVE